MFKKRAAKRIKLDISYAAIFKVLLIVFLVVFLYLVRNVLLILFLAFIIASAIMPAVNFLESKKISIFLGVLLIYLLLVSVLALVVFLIIPPITEQLGQFAGNLPDYYHKIDLAVQKWGFIDNNGDLSDLIQSNWSTLMGSGKTIFDTLGGVVGAVFTLVLSMIIAFYISVQKDSLQRLVVFFTPKKKREYAAGLVDRIQEKLGAWLKGQLLLCLVIGALAYIGLTILGVKYALVLGLIAGATEIVPYVGPFIGGGVGVLVALAQSPILAILVLVMYLLIQQLENALVVPVIMRKAVGLNPIITIVAITAGSSLAGAGGAIIAIPLAATLSILLKDAWDYKNKINAKK